MKNKINVSILGSLPPIRALSSYCYELTKSITRYCNINFISYKKIYPEFLYPGGKLENDYSYPELKLNNLEIKRNLTWYNPISWLNEVFCTQSEILHAQWWSLPLFPIYLILCFGFKLRGKKVIFTVHNVLDHKRSFLYSFLSQILFKSGDYFIVHTVINKKQLNDHYHIPLEKISVIPHGPLDFHVKKGALKTIEKRKLGLNENKKIILIFGAVRPYKGIQTAIKALKKVITKIPSAHLVIAGKLWEDWEPYANLIKEFKLENDITLFLDYIPSNEVYRYYVSADLILLPYTHFDSQSGIGATAISFRKPMIVSNTGGLPDLVSDSNYIVTPGDATALANSILLCLNSPEKLNKMKMDAKKTAEKISWDFIAEKTYDVYEQMIYLQH